MTTELLAQVLELTSVMAARKQLKKPISVPRPKHIEQARDAAAAWTGPRGDRDARPAQDRDSVAAQPVQVRPGGDPAFAKGIDVLRRTAKVVR